MFSDSKLSYALSSLYGFIVELPAPWYLGVLAISPISAIFDVFCNGSKLFSFFSRTIDSSAIFCAILWCSVLSYCSNFLSAHLNAMFSILSTI